MMADNDPKSSSRRESIPASGAEDISAAQRSIWFWFSLILGVNVAGLVWLAVRSESPAFVRSILDVLLHTATGAAVAYLAFRALLYFPFRFFDLLIMVTVLSLGMKMTVDFVQGLAAMGIVNSTLASGERFGEIFQLCLWSGSVLVGGAALGLRHCTLLKIDKHLPRAACLIAGMLVLPAAAGVTGFPVLLIRELFKERPNTGHSLDLLLLWCGSLIATAINARRFMRTLTLTAAVDAQEKMPNKS